MARKVDPALTRQAISWLKRARARAEKSGEGVTAWEDEFLTSVEERLEQYGSAFTDPDKGQLSAPLSLRQGLKVRQIGKRGAEDRRKPGARQAGRATDEPAREGDGPEAGAVQPKPRFGQAGGGGGGLKRSGFARKSGLARKSPLRNRKRDQEKP